MINDHSRNTSPGVAGDITQEKYRQGNLFLRIQNTEQYYLIHGLQSIARTTTTLTNCISLRGGHSLNITHNT